MMRKDLVGLSLAKTRIGKKDYQIKVDDEVEVTLHTICLPNERVVHLPIFLKFSIEDDECHFAAHWSERDNYCPRAFL